MNEISVNQMLTERRARLQRDLEGMNLSRLAVESGVSRTTLWRLREGIGDAGPETVDAIEQTLRSGTTIETGA